MLKRRGDLVLIVVLVIIGLSTFAYTQLILPKRGKATKVLIEIEGKVVQTFDLGRNLDPVKFETKYGSNTVEVKDGRVRVLEADCPDLLCVNTGWRQHPGQLIVCLPNYFVVRLEAADKGQQDLDGFTY